MDEQPKGEKPKEKLETKIFRFMGREPANEEGRDGRLYYFLPLQNIELAEVDLGVPRIAALVQRNKLREVKL